MGALARIGSRAHLFVDHLASPRLTEADSHHVWRVLRLRPGDEVTVCDGAGRWRRCRLVDAGEPALVPDGEVEWEERLRPAVTVAFALTKGERPEWTVQKLTELDVDTIVPFFAERSVVRWDPRRVATQSERWRRIAREAASQSRRAWLPEVADIVAFADVARLPGAALADRAGEPPSLDHPVALVGPEGGWSAAERDAAAGLPRLDLGWQVLRAETAAVAAATLLCGLRAGLVAPARGGPDPE